MLQQVWTSTQVASAPTPASVSIGERRGVLVVNRSPYWLAAMSGPMALYVIPAWFAGRFQVPPPRRNFILQVYQQNGANVTDPDISSLAHGVWVDADHYVEHEGLEPVGNLSQLTGSSALYDGQNSSVTTTPGALAATQACTEVSVQADPSNTAGVLVGSATSQHTVLAAGQSIDLSVNDVALIYVTAVSGTQKVNYLARS